jgi:hypothetical protein
MQVRLNGWHRIGILISVLLLIAIVGFRLKQHDEMTNILFQLCTRTGKTFAECWEEDRPIRELSGAWLSDVLLQATVMIGLFWLASYIVVWLKRWIVAGFRNAKT